MSNKFNFLTGRDHPYLKEFDGMKIHKKIIPSLVELKEAAKDEMNIDLTIISGFRDYKRQQIIWDEKALGKRNVFDDYNTIQNPKDFSDIDFIKKIMRFSALPGASRHHWGTDIDIFDQNIKSKNDVILNHDESENDFKVLHQWLTDRIENNDSFGFFRPYDKDLGGISKEKWHLSFAPLAQEYYDLYDLNTFIQNIKSSDIIFRDKILENAESLYNQFIKLIVLPL